MPSIIRAAKLGDAAIIKAIIKILDNENINVISSIFFNPELTAKSGNYSKLKPNISDIDSIKKGIVNFDNIFFVPYRSSVAKIVPSLTITA